MSVTQNVQNSPDSTASTDSSTAADTASGAAVGAARTAGRTAGRRGTAITAEETITTLRKQIDALDAAIIALVSERLLVSQRAQAARVNDGGTRVELGRERQILASYKQGLGRRGQHLADAVLQVCRGEQGIHR